MAAKAAAAREKAAQAKATRDAKARALREEQQAAAQLQAEKLQAEQDAARLRVEQARVRAAATAPPAPVQRANPPATPKPAGVRELCAGRNLISEALCQSRECAKPAHAGEPMCKELKATEEERRRQGMQ
ncbi:MAG: hypothetical protein ABIP61_08985 [Burkholderiaceae bacterium]